jgi:hypothetical protein
MRKLALILLFSLAGCGKSKGEVQRKQIDLQVLQTPVLRDSDANIYSARSVSHDEIVESNISHSSNPAGNGIAKTYAYSFRLPPLVIAKTQERHASECEHLAPRCRITGMEYHSDGSRTISASLNIKLSPMLARKFGGNAAALTSANGGLLTDSVVSGTDEAQSLSNVERASASVTDEEVQIEKQLERSGMAPPERTLLWNRLIDLRDARRLADFRKAEAEGLLATTPMSFVYVSAQIDRGLQDDQMLSAVKTGWSNIVSGSAMILTFAISILPWALIAALGYAIFKYASKKLISEPGSE